MRQKRHPGAQWTARRAAFLVVLLALVIAIPAPAGRFETATIPPAPLGPLGPLGPLSPEPPATPPAPELEGAIPEVASPDPALDAAAPGCNRRHCAFLPMAVQGQSGGQTGGSPLSRSAAVDFYRQNYLPASNVTPGWNGNINACSAGQTSQPFRDAVLSRINYFRVMAGIPPLEGLDSLYNDIDQKAALMMSANNALSHTPPNNWRCFTPEGRDGAGSSNLYLGAFGPNAITGYMRDPGAGNTAAGHRRWILYPQSKRLGTGDIPGGSGFSQSNALRSWDNNFGGPRPATRDTFVAWPPPGFVPYPVVFARWSFAYPNANFDSATVSMSRGGAAVPVTRYATANGYGENTLVWLVNNMNDGADWPRPAADEAYTVTIRNVIIDGQSREFTYTVTVINPE